MAKYDVYVKETRTVHYVVYGVHSGEDAVEAYRDGSADHCCDHDDNEEDYDSAYAEFDEWEDEDCRDCDEAYDSCGCDVCEWCGGKNNSDRDLSCACEKCQDCGQPMEDDEYCPDCERCHCSECEEDNFDDCENDNAKRDRGDLEEGRKENNEPVPNTPEEIERNREIAGEQDKLRQAGKGGYVLS